MFLGKIGIKTCFQHNGKRNDIKATAAWFNKALCSDISSIFFSNNSAMNISITCSASNALNKYSISDLVAYGGY
jgi:hypothetical protein